MHSEGEQDAAAGLELVLLDIGAQLNDRSGVLLSATNRKIDWVHLVNALNAYLAGYAGTSGTVAIATNNDGNWHEYPATARGRDWANKVIDALTVPIGVNVAVRPTSKPPGQRPRAGAELGGRVSGRDVPAAVLRRVSGRLPSTFGATGGTCRFGWTERQYYALAIRAADPGAPADLHAGQRRAVGEHRRDRRRWVAVRRRAHRACGRAARSQRPAQGWAALYRALSARINAPNLPLVLDLRSDD